MRIFQWTGNKPFIRESWVQSFQMETFELLDSRAMAAGNLTIIDPTAKREKDRSITLPWCARSAVSAGKVSPEWLVRRSETELRFCRGREHDTICVFVRNELKNYTETCTRALNGENLTENKSGPPKPVPAQEIPAEKIPAETLSPERFKTRPIEPQQSACACARLESSQRYRPFEKPGGQGVILVNERTLVCTCGQKWWLQSPKAALWTRVFDTYTWTYLLRNGGESKNGLALLPGGVTLFLSVGGKIMPCARI